MNKILLVYEDYADLMAAEGALKKAGFDVLGLSSEYSVAEQMLAFNPDLVVGAGRGGKVSSLGVGKRLKEMNRWGGKSVLIFPANFKPDPQELIKIRVDMVLEAPVSPLRLVQVVGKILGHDEAVLLERLNKAMHVESPQRTGGMIGGRPSSEEEAIFVKGSLPSETQEVAGESEESLLSDEENERKLDFRFGDRMSGAHAVTSGGRSSGDEEETFSSVDLKALEQELLGGGVPEVERVEIEDPQAKARADLEKAQAQVAERVSKYQNLVADVKVAPKSTLTRVEARRRQRQMTADWDSQEIEALDELRRQFTKALFKK